MKYILFLSAIFLTLGTALAEDADTDPDSPGFYDRVRGILSDTLNTVQTVDVPTIGSGAVLTTIECDEITRSESGCQLLNGVQGVNVCRDIGGTQVTFCAPFVLGNYIGAVRDTCGCCGAVDENGQRTGQKCQAEEKQCKCSCQEGRGILVKHDLIKLFGRQISWNACYTPTIAANVLAARSEFSCYDGCEEAADETGDAGDV